MRQGKFMHLAFSSMNTLNDPHPAELARALEERGFESLWYGEHSHIPCSRKTPYPPGGEMPDPYRRKTCFGVFKDRDQPTSDTGGTTTSNFYDRVVNIEWDQVQGQVNAPAS